MEQLSIFDLLAESKPLLSNIKLLSLFSGIGAFEKALDNLGIGYELVGYCEIDKYASKSYSAIHGVSEDKNLWDVTKVDEKALPKDIDLITYGFPCQDISLAGKQKGLFNEDGSKTRSGLFFDALRIIEETKPRVAIAENVKNLVGKKFKEQFQIVLASLEAAGYNNYWQVLNSKDFGVPQNRERVFIVSIRKGIDKGYTFPKGFPLEKRLKDVLEDTVDEKYYLSDKMVDYLATITEKNKARGNGNVYSPSDVDGVSKTITTQEGSRVKDNFIEEPIIHQEHNNRVLVWDGYNQRIRADQSCVGTLTTMCGADLKRHGQGIIEPINPMPDDTCRTIKSQYSFTAITCTTRTGSMGATMVSEKLPDDVPQNEKDQVYKVKDQSVKFIGKNNNVVEYPMNLPNGTFKIRKLTPKECFRLMGFDDADFHKAESVNSNTQLYKQAGNSIVVDVLEYILKQIFNAI